MKGCSKAKCEYIGNCIGMRPSFVNALKDSSIEITFTTFYKHVDKQEIKEMFPVYDKYMKIEDDYAVSCHRSKHKGKFYYFIKHSSIEYIWR